jgi:C_GCAxxG_C_C family probable redox protein
MMMNSHKELVKELFAGGYNCAQAVFAAYCDETGMDKKTAIKISSSFGGGMGKLLDTCGAVTALFMVAGLKYGYTDMADADAKAAHYALIRQLAARFKEKNGSYICRELLGITGPEDMNPPPGGARHYPQCKGFVLDAAEILDELIAERVSEASPQP